MGSQCSFQMEPGEDDMWTLEANSTYQYDNHSTILIHYNLSTFLLQTNFCKSPWLKFNVELLVAIVLFYSIFIVIGDWTPQIHILSAFNSYDCMLLRHMIPMQTVRSNNEIEHLPTNSVCEYNLQECCSMYTTIVIILYHFCYLSITIVITGALGNGLVCWVVLANRHMRTPRNLLILNLATSDLILCLFTQPFNLLKIATNAWRLGAFMCKMVILSTISK